MIVVLDVCSIKAQNSDFNHRISIQNRSTIIKNINVEKDSLILTGEIGSDSSGLQGIFIAWSDTLGNLGRVKIFKDPKQTDQMLIDGSHPIINDTDKLIVSGEFLWKSDNYFINKKQESIFLKNTALPFLYA